MVLASTWPIRFHTDIQVYICSTALTFLSGCPQLVTSGYYSSLYCSTTLVLLSGTSHLVTSGCPTLGTTLCSTALTLLSGCPPPFTSGLYAGLYCSTTLSLPIRIHTDIQVYICSTALTLLSGCHQLCHIRLISSFHCSTALTLLSGYPTLGTSVYLFYCFDFAIQLAPNFVTADIQVCIVLLP